MNTWNGLPSRYWEKVLATVRATLNSLILRDAGVNTTPSEVIDTRGISYNPAAMAALLEEPEIEQPNLMGIDIPAASEVYFDAENGVGEEGNTTADEAVVEAVDMGEADEGDIEGSGGEQLAGSVGDVVIRHHIDT